MVRCCDDGVGVDRGGDVGTDSMASRIGITRVDGGETHDPATPPIAQPAGQGDGRPGPLGQSTLQALLNLPHEWLNLARVIADARNVLVDALAREAWANRSDCSNQAQDGTIGSGCYILALKAHPSQAIHLRNLLVGTSTAGTVQLVASRSTQLLGANPAYRLIGTIRTNANALSQWFPPEVTLDPEENLFLIYTTGASVNFDLSCEWRVLKG